VAGGAGPSWLVLWGLCHRSWLVVWGPRRCSSVVVCWAFVAVSGWWCGALVCHLWCWELVIFHGWRGWVLVALFMDGGSGPCHAVSGWWWWCTLIGFRVLRCMALITLMVVLSLFEGEGGGWLFMFADAPSVVVPRWHRVVVLHCFRVLLLRVLAVSLSPALLIVVPCHCCCRALIVTCHCNDDAQRQMSLFIVWLPHR